MSYKITAAKSVGIITLAGLISRILGFLREAFISGFFGQSYVTDAYLAGFAVPDLFYNLLVVGALSSAFIPVLSSYLVKQKKEEAWYVASSIINLVLLFLSIFTIIVLIFTPEIISLYIPHAPIKTQMLAIEIMRILLLQPILLCLSGFSMGILNSLKIFAPSAIGSIIYALCVILFGTILRPYIGIKGFAVGVVIGALGNFLVQIPALYKTGFKYTFCLDFKNNGTRKIAKLAFPMILSFALGQVPVIVYQNLASALPPGSLSSFMYAYRLQQLPIGIFVYSIGLVVFPTLTEAVNSNQLLTFRKSFSFAFRSIMFIIIPISIVMIVLAEPLITVVFQHGEFKYQDTLATVPSLIFFAIGIIGQSALVVLPRAFYALQDTWTPLLVSGIVLIINIILMNTLVKPLAQGGLALAISISGIVNMLLLLYFLKKKIGFIYGRQMIVSLIKILLASIIMGVVVWIIFHFISALVSTNFLNSLFSLVICTCIGLTLYMFLAVRLRMKEIEVILNILRQKFAK